MIRYVAADLAQFPVAVPLRAEMAAEMGSHLDMSGTAWRDRFCTFFRDKQRDGRAQLFLAYDENEAIGMTIVSLTNEWRTFCFGTQFAFVNAVYVRPEYRRRGAGRELMRRAIEWARAAGCARVRLRTSEEGRALYESVGFHRGREMELDL